MKILVTGGAGFIGSSLAQKLLERGDSVLLVDNFNDYYNPEFKRRNIKELLAFENCLLAELDFCNRLKLSKAFESFQPDVVAHLGAMANVRYSVKNPQVFIDVNISGTNNLLELSVEHQAKNFVFASTGSIYGARDIVPFKETDQSDSPLAAYPATKKSAELLGHAYNNIHGLNFTSLRFFNVYGPKGRPDMMPYRVTESILNQEEIPIFGQGEMERDWTYVDDLVKGFIAAIDRPQGYEIVNLGRGNPVSLNNFMQVIQNVIGKAAIIKNVPTPQSEVPRTFADITKAQKLFDYQPKVDLEEGLTKFWKWYQEIATP